MIIKFFNKIKNYNIKCINPISNAIDASYYI